MATSTVKTNKPLNPRGVDNRPVDKYNRAKIYSGKALDFDGVNDQITFGTISDLTFGTGDFSAVLDWQIDSVSSYSWAIAKKPALDFGIGINNTGGLLRLWIGGTLSLGTENILGSDWKKIAVVRESGVVSAYINGVAISLTETAMAGSIDSGDLFVGSWVSSIDFWNGLLNNIRLFNVALTAAQVADLYNNPEKVVPTGVADSALKLWLPMQEGAGTTSYDGSGNGNHGTISGATWTHGIGAPVSQTAVISWNKGTNLILNSNKFDTTWQTAQASVSGSQPDRFGGSNAWLFSRTSSVGYLYQTKTLTNVKHSVSIYAKEGTSSSLKLEFVTSAFGKGADCSFDLSNGTAGSITHYGNSSGFTASISSVGSGWYRIGLTGTTTAEIWYIELALASGNVYIQDAQMNVGDIGPYIPTLSTAQTSEVLLPQGLTSGRDITGVNLFENVRKQGALNLDGNSWAEVHDNASLDVSHPCTLEAWVNNKTYEISARTRYMPIFDKATAQNGTGGFTLRIYSPTINYGGYIGVGGSFSTFNFTDGSYQHIVVTLEANSQKVYINGALQNSFTNAWTLSQNNRTLKIGYAPSDGTQWLNASVAQPRIYNRALTAAEVKQNYDATKDTYI